MIRKPAVNGNFYPDDKGFLKKQIGAFLGRSQKIIKEKLQILIVPHAGYEYSGQTAAWGFKQLENQGYQKVILIGASHRNWFDKAAVYDCGIWETPLGRVNIDAELAKNLITQNNFIEANVAVHKEEHSLEVEVPFLQQVLGDFKLVPILLSRPNPEVLEALAAAIANNFDEKTLIVISTDLSHYPTFEVANEIDKKTIQLIINGEAKKFSSWIKQSEKGGIQGVETAACASSAVSLGLRLAKILAIDKIKLLHYENSGEVTADKSRVVGYAAIGFYRKLQLKIKNLISEGGQKKLLKITRETLKSYLEDKKIPSIKIDDEELNQKLGVFVTLRKDGQLRGCIGEFEPKDPLYKLVRKKTIDSATNDPRFYSVEASELKSIKIEISVLSPRQKINDWRKIELAKHGVLIKRGGRGGTFLPQVAKETGWDLEELLSHLCSDKAGLPADSYKDQKTEIFIYTAQVFTEK